MTATIKERVKAPLITENVKVKIAEIEALDLSFVRDRVLSEGSIPEVFIDAVEVEYRRWLMLLLVAPRGLSMFSKLVDEMWHAHILFTAQYMATTEAIHGRYLHHSPFTMTNRPSKTDTVRAAREFRTMYVQTFGVRPSAKIWKLGTNADPTAECNGECGYCDHGVVQRSCDGSPACRTCNGNCTSPGPGPSCADGVTPEIKSALATDCRCSVPSA